MGLLGKSFQRIRYHRLRFEIVAGWPSTVAGTYVAGFVRDATDPVHSNSATSTLLASGGNAVKFWQSTNVNVGSLPDLYYTSSDPEEKRWASPGSFVISIVGAPSESASFEIFAHWDVSFYEPTYEAEQSDAGFATALVDMYTSTGNKYLSKRNGSDWSPVNFNDFSPPLFNGAVLTVLSMRSASVQTAAGNLSGVYNFRQLKALSSGVYPIDDNDAVSPLKFYDEDYVVFKGEKMDLHKPPNEQTVSWFRSTLRRHERSGLSVCRKSPNLSNLEQVPIGVQSSSTRCMSGTEMRDSIRQSAKLLDTWQKLQELLKENPSLRDQLSQLMGSSMECPQLSRASSLTSFEEI